MDFDPNAASHSATHHFVVRASDLLLSLQMDSDLNCRASIELRTVRQLGGECWRGMQARPR